MPTNAYAVTVRCPIELAFDYVADVTQHPEWAMDRMSVERQSAEPSGVGTRYRTVGHSEVWNKDNEAEVEVTRHERPAAFEIVCRDPHGEFRHLFTFRAEDDGRVLIERHYTTPEVLSEEARQRVMALMPTVIEPSRRGAMAKLGERLEKLALPAGGRATEGRLSG
ncbi:MAG TPA: SRPBCC family protein [Candidatus Dormibacteraeota bacterium]|jgi:uncharacterized protein YndB with AHSA1/START domain